MAEDKLPKWMDQVGKILKEQFPDDDYSEQLKKAVELVNLTNEVEIPSGDTGQFVAVLLKQVSRQMHPLTAVYVGFQLGVAWERFQNAD